ncbi:MAG: NAD+ synthase [Tepidisphaera sp.]|nr:NAD+ synthase [Tepidisphaera sp.]
MRLTLAPINPTVGDLAANTARAHAAIAAARAHHADVIILPELCIGGYPPKDLLLEPGFIAACHTAARTLGEQHSRGLTLIFGTPLPGLGATCTNSLLVYRDGHLLARYDKRLLPTYDVFDEDRYFAPGDKPVVVDGLGLAICEDLWRGEDAGFASRYAGAPDPVADAVAAGAKILLSPSASPFVLGKGQKHRDILAGHAQRHRIPVLSVNQLGGNDDLIFDGHAYAFAPDGSLAAQSRLFSGDSLTVDITDHGAISDAGDEALRISGSPAPSTHPTHQLANSDDDQLLYHALVLGVRDYLAKTGFTSAIIGLSGGIDSALTAVIAAAALGPANVLGVAMPSKYSSSHSIEDAQDLARRLSIRCLLTPIEPGVVGGSSIADGAFHQLGVPGLGRVLPDIAEENLQSRVRGTLLMTLSNRTGAIVLTTGNKSELAVGYCTLYGDMNGGLAVLSDVTKQLVYRLSRWINAHAAPLGFSSPPIPQRTIDKPPSAELRPNQTDQDSLPPYDVLDEIIERRVNARQSPRDIVAATGFDAATVARVVRLISLAEYKRKQAAIGLKVTSVAFGSGRRVPIAQRWSPEA